MRKICKLIYSILASCVIIFKRAKTKYLLECFFRHLYYLFINKDLLDSKLSLSNNTKLYKKFFDIKISKIDILVDKKDNKIVNRLIASGRVIEFESGTRPESSRIDS